MTETSGMGLNPEIEEIRLGLNELVRVLAGGGTPYRLAVELHKRGWRLLLEADEAQPKVSRG